VSQLVGNGDRTWRGRSTGASHAHIHGFDHDELRGVRL
jgi:hypothetical protein